MVGHLTVDRINALTVGREFAVAFRHDVAFWQQTRPSRRNDAIAADDADQLADILCISTVSVTGYERRAG